MPVTGFSLTFCGVPFVNDYAKSHRSDPGGDGRPLHARHQDADSMLREIEERFRLGLCRTFSRGDEYPGRNVGHLARSLRSRAYPDLAIGEWYYPFGASRTSVFLALASSTQAKAMLARGQSGGAFVMRNEAGHGASRGRTYEVTTTLRMLPPRQVAETAQDGDGLYLITLVDERYFWRYRQATIRPTYATTWESLISQLATTLGVTVNYSTIDAAFASPEPDSQFWCSLEDAALLLDAVAYNVGRVVVREYDGTYSLLTPDESRARAQLSRKTADPGNPFLRNMGGDAYQSGGVSLRAGDLRAARNLAMPSQVAVSYPKYVTQGTPHFYDQRSGTAQYRDSYGDVYTVTVPIASGGAYFSGVTGFSGTAPYRDTAKALYSGDANALAGDTPYNASGLTALSMAVARAHWGALNTGLDEQYTGALKWTPDGLHDIVWTWCGERQMMGCRVMRPEWTAAPQEMQHCVPVGGTYPPTPPPGGGTTYIDAPIITADQSNYPSPVADVVYLSSTQAVTISGVTLPTGAQVTYTNTGSYPITFANSSSLHVPGNGQVILGTGESITVLQRSDYTSVLNTITNLNQTQQVFYASGGTYSGVNLTPGTKELSFSLSSGSLVTSLLNVGDGQSVTIRNPSTNTSFLTLDGFAVSGSPYQFYFDDTKIYPGEQLSLFRTSSGYLLEGRQPLREPQTITVTGGASGWPQTSLLLLDPTRPVYLNAVSGTVINSVLLSGSVQPGAQFQILNVNSGIVTFVTNASGASLSGGTGFYFSTSGNINLYQDQSLVLAQQNSGFHDVGGSIATAGLAISGSFGGGGGSVSGGGFWTVGILGASGNSQATANLLTYVNNEVFGADGSRGVVLDSGYGMQSVANADLLNSVKVYPPTGGQINGLGANNPYTQPLGTWYAYWHFMSGRWRTQVIDAV